MSAQDSLSPEQFPVPGDAVKCGNRLDLPKKQRRHTFADLGVDTRNMGASGFQDRRILACVNCGTDKSVRLDGQS